MYVLILTLAIGTTAPPAITTAEFTSQRTCLAAGSAWAAQTKQTYGSTARFTAVCMPK